MIPAGAGRAVYGTSAVGVTGERPCVMGGQRKAGGKDADDVCWTDLFRMRRCFGSSLPLPLHPR